jgi:hypothetical protein
VAAKLASERPYFQRDIKTRVVYNKPRASAGGELPGAARSEESDRKEVREDRVGGAVGDMLRRDGRFRKASSRKGGQEDPTSRSRKGVVGDLENVFAGEDKRAFKAIAGDLLITLGYEKSNDW